VINKKLNKHVMKKRFSGRLLHLYTMPFKYPNGHKTILEIIKHPGAVLIVPFISKNSIILLKQYRPVIKEYIWELPAGTLDKNENIIKCAKRELEEETSYRAKVLTKIGYIYPAPGYTTEKIWVFKAKTLYRVFAECEADEIIEPVILSLRQVKKMYSSGKIKDAKTLCALKMASCI